MISFLTSFAFALRRLAIVFRLTVNLFVFLVFAQMCVKHRKSNVSGFPSLASSFSVCRCKSAKLDKAGFLLVQFQTELRHALTQRLKKVFRFLSVLESDYEIIGISHNDYVATSTLSPAVYPQIQNVVKVDIRQNR